MTTLIKIDDDYAEWIRNLSLRFKQSQIKAAIKVNSEMLRFYFSLGADIVNKKAESRWGDGFFKNLSKDLQNELPDVRGFSETNLRYSKYFYLLYNQTLTIHPQVGDKFYNQDFIISPQVGDQLDIFQIPWSHHKYIIDKCKKDTDKAHLHCYVVIEIKTKKFEPSFLGQLSGYVSCANHILKRDGDNPTVGLLICKDKDEVMAHYALEGYNNPLGISEYELSKLFPKDFRSTLPSIEDIEKELGDNNF